MGLAVPIRGSICGRAVEERRTVNEGDVSSDPRYIEMLGSGIKSEIAVPIKGRFRERYAELRTVFDDVNTQQDLNTALDALERAEEEFGDDELGDDA